MCSGTTPAKANESTGRTPREMNESSILLQQRADLFYQYDTPKTKDHHGPERITHLIREPADMSGIESEWNQEDDANQRNQKFSFLSYLLPFGVQR